MASQQLPLPDDPWIGVAEVAAELNLSPRAAWELVKRLAIPMLNSDRRMTQIRFRRSKWTAARDAAEQPPVPRTPARSSFAPATPAKPRATKPTEKARTAAIVAAHLADLRKI